MSIKISEKKVLADTAGSRIVQIKVGSREIAQKAKAGQFIVLMASEEGERIPLTIADVDNAKTTLAIIFQEAGLTTRLLGKLEAGDSLYAIAGPLGHPTEIHQYGKLIIVGGGVGIAEIYPVAKALKVCGNELRQEHGIDLLILEDTKSWITHNHHDGSSGKKGFVTDILKELLSAASSKYSLVYAVGPIPMMRKVAETTKSFSVKTLVSLNALMVDATGMCGCCRVSISGQTKFSCVDGPEFDAHEVDWDELIKRNNIYRDKEQHICKLLIK